MLEVDWNIVNAGKETGISLLLARIQENPHFNKETGISLLLVS